jgi:DNA-binding NtrC family response regulator
MTAQNVLIVEDEEIMRAILRELLETEGYKVFSADSAETAISLFTSNDISVTLTDIKMSGRDGLELLDHIKSIDAEAVVIIMTAYSSVETAVAALRKGAYDYITKPFVNPDLIQTVKNAVAHRSLFQENRYLRREIKRKYNFSQIIGTSDALLQVLELVKKVASTSANVLIQGESGTGKELVARAIHFNSGRSEKPFLAVNCGALPESLLESELFGHQKGAFTGAISDKKGLFRSVAGGTLFLDEVAEMPASLQVKLLRALQEHEVTPVGASIPVSFDARIIAATNKVLENEVAAGNFREDLFYRLNVVEIDIPPLRERRDDIDMLVRHFVIRACKEQGSPTKSVSPAAMERLMTYDWPGNIRELDHVIERAVIVSRDEINIDSLPPKIAKATAGRKSGRQQPSLDDVERDYVLSVLESVREDKALAAQILGIDLSTLYRKLKKYGSDMDHLPESSKTK